MGGPFETKNENTKHNSDEKRGGEKVMPKCEHRQLCLSFPVCLLQNTIGRLIACVPKIEIFALCVISGLFVFCSMWQLIFISVNTKSSVSISG